MTKSELACEIAGKAGVSAKVAAKVLDAAIDEIKATIKDGEEVTLRGFGTFKSVHKAAKQARNIATGEPIVVAAHDEPVFKASKEFKQYMK